jgi:hypothetical protein
MGGMGNVVVNTIVRMFTRKAVGKAMKSAKKSMGAKKSKQDGGHKGRPKRTGAKNKKVIDEGDRGFPKRRQERDGQRKSSRNVVEGSHGKEMKDE